MSCREIIYFYMQVYLILDLKLDLLEIEHIVVLEIQQMPTEQLIPKRKNRSVSSFLKKTYQILEQPQNAYAIKWSQSGIGFVVIKQEEFSKQILPRYFKHSNYSSFVRQLNMYNFHKIRQANYESHFRHECFRKNNKALLSEIKRKPQKKKRKNQQQSQEDADMANDHFNDKSDVSMKHRIKNNTSSLCRILTDDVKIKSYKMTSDKKMHENTCHVFKSQKQNEYEVVVHSDRPIQSLTVEQSQQKERVSIQNILSSHETDQDKLSINNELGEMFPRYPTKQIFCPSNNNIYPLPYFNFKGNALSHFSILF